MNKRIKEWLNANNGKWVMIGSTAILGASENRDVDVVLTSDTEIVQELLELYHSGNDDKINVAIGYEGALPLLNQLRIQYDSFDFVIYDSIIGVTAAKKAMKEMQKYSKDFLAIKSNRVEKFNENLIKELSIELEKSEEKCEELENNLKILRFRVK